jgi:hypothetical protein
MVADNHSIQTHGIQEVPIGLSLKLGKIQGTLEYIPRMKEETVRFLCPEGFYRCPEPGKTAKLYEGSFCLEFGSNIDLKLG